MANSYHTVLYTGVTSDLTRRVDEHKSKHSTGFTQRYNVKFLVYYERCSTMVEAIFREKMIKKKSGDGKIRLIETLNPEWRDLSRQ